MLLEIRKLSVDSIDLDEAVAALAMSKMIKAEYAAHEVPAPEWLSERVDELDREVRSRKRDYLERSLRAAKARRESLKSREQRAEETDAEVARLQGELAKL